MVDRGGGGSRGGGGGRVASIVTSLSIDDEDDHDNYDQRHDHHDGYVGMSSGDDSVPRAGGAQSWRPPTPPRSPNSSSSSSSPNNDGGGVVGTTTHSIFSWLGLLRGGRGRHEAVVTSVNSSDDVDEEAGGGGGRRRRVRGGQHPSAGRNFDESLLLHEEDSDGIVGGGGDDDVVAEASRLQRRRRRRERERTSFRRRIADSVGSDAYNNHRNDEDGYRNVTGAVVGSPSRLRSRQRQRARSDGNDNDVEGGGTSYAAMDGTTAEDPRPPPPPRRSPETVREECSFFYGGADVDGKGGDSGPSRQRPSSGSTFRSLWSEEGDGSSSASRRRRRQPGILEEDAATWRPSARILDSEGYDTADDGDDLESNDISASSVVHTSLPVLPSNRNHHPSSPTSFVRKSSLYAASESASTGKIQIRLPVDNVRLVMDPNLEPGVLCVVVTDEMARLRRRLYFGDDRYYYPSTGGSKLIVDGMVRIEDDEVLQRRMQSEPLRYILTVDEDLYRRVIDEMADARNSPCGLYFCCHDGSEDDPHGRVNIIIAVLILTVVFIFLLADTIVWPFD